jgi:tagaturonate epimerase
MSLNKIMDLSVQKESKSNNLIDVIIPNICDISIYPFSITSVNGGVVFIGKNKANKFLFTLMNKNSAGPLWNNLEGSEINLGGNYANLQLKQCEMNHKNALVIKGTFSWANPKLLGVSNSFGMGDRIGLANPGHIRSLKGYEFRPILAQQSIRELTRTQRTADEVMDAAVWAVLQEGYKEGFGSDADHLKTTEDIDLMMNAGYTMYTFDPSEHVNNDADTVDENELDKIISTLNWKKLESNFEALLSNYADKSINISKDYTIKPAKIELKRALVKYGNAITHIKFMYDYIKSAYPSSPFEVEVSVDETDSVTTPFEHFFIASELKRLNVVFVSLAPRFVGAFEKGIDYKGDVNLFRQEYVKHLAITKFFGSYKISLHSGSDKFTVYAVIGSIHEAFTHVKTAGTSYLEATKVVAISEPALFREILDFGRGLYETEKKSYHVSAVLANVKPAKEYSDKELVDLFNSNDARQVLHVTFGKVLTEKKADGSYLFKDKILDCLKRNEELHYSLLEKHFIRHLEPFKQ